MSTISRFWRLCGLTSPNALPTIFSYCPTPGHVKPPKVGDSVAVISMRVMRASASGGAMSPAAASASRVLLFVDIGESPPQRIDFERFYGENSARIHDGRESIQKHLQWIDAGQRVALS